MLRIGRNALAVRTWLIALVSSVLLSAGWGGVLNVDAQRDVTLDRGTCSTAEECFTRALHLLDHERRNPEPRWESAIARLSAIESRFPDSVWAQRASVHLALLFREIAPAQAIPRLQEARTTFPVLEDYFQFWLGEAYDVHLSDIRRAAEAFEAVFQRDPDSVLSAEARFRAGEAWMQLDSCDRGLPLIQQAVQEHAEAEWAPRAFLSIGQCGLRLHQMSIARDALRAVWARYPLAPEAETAEALLREVPEGDPTPTEAFERAHSLYRAARFDAAVSAWQHYLAYGRDQAENWDKARLYLGLAHARLRQYEKAEEIFRSLALSRSPMTGQATVWLGRVYLRQGDGAKLLALCRSNDQAHLSGNQRALLWIFCGVWLQDHDKMDEALQAYQNAAKVATARSRRFDALWRIGWIRYQHGQYDRAISTFRAIVDDAEHSHPGGEDRLRALYWMGRANEQIGHVEAAHSLYRTLGQSFPYTYYGQLAQARLQSNGAKLVATRPRPIEASISNVSVAGQPSEVERDRHYRKAVQLADLHLFAYAARELDALVTRYRSQTTEWPSLIALAQRVHAYHVGIRLAVKQHGMDLQRGGLPLSSPVWAAAFPRGYWSAIQAHDDRGVDPYLVFGIIREESLYDRYARSHVGALGLMQLMPETARTVARALNLPPISDASLFDPFMNIQLGATYVARLLERFQGNVVYAVAAYNAGPHVVRKWMVRHGDRPADEFVESIAYRETRRYVKRVLGSYRIYHALDGGTCRAMSLDRVC